MTARFGRLILPFLSLALALAGCTPGPLDKASRSVFLAGHESFKAGRYQDADQAFTQVISRNPNSWALSEVHYFRGLARLHLGRRADAKNDFRAGATHYGRELTQIYSAVALANLEYEEGDDETAAHLYRRILDHPVKGLPIDAVLFRLGASLQRLGRWAEADETFARLITKHPKSELVAEARRRFQASCFTVQVGAFTDRNKAEGLAARLRREGFPVTLAVAADADRTFHTVNVGRYRTFREASSAADRLQAKGYQVVIKP